MAQYGLTVMEMHEKTLLMDGGAVFFAVRDLYEGAHFHYDRLLWVANAFSDNLEASIAATEDQRGTRRPAHEGPGVAEWFTGPRDNRASDSKALSRALPAVAASLALGGLLGPIGAAAAAALGATVGALSASAAKAGNSTVRPADGSRLRPRETPPGTAVMWTSYDRKNEGQGRFLQSVKSAGWTVRRTAPSEAPGAFVASTPSEKQSLSSRAIRFDASISFALGRLAEQRVTVVSDSYALAEPLLRARRIRGGHVPNVLAFFGRALDQRWMRVLRQHPEEIVFLDLDAFPEVLVGQSEQQLNPDEEDYLEDRFLLR